VGFGLYLQENTKHLRYEVMFRQIFCESNETNKQWGGGEISSSLNLGIRYKVTNSLSRVHGDEEAQFAAMQVKFHGTRHHTSTTYKFLEH